MIFPASTRLAVTAVAAASLLTLSACGGNSSSSTSPTATASANPSSQVTGSTSPSESASTTPSASASVKKKEITSLDAVTVTGAFGSAPTVKASYPFVINKTQSKVLVQGSGATVVKGAYITFNYEGINATTGKTFDSSFAKGRTPLSMQNTQLIAGFTSQVVGKKVGDRVLMVITGADGYDYQGGQGGFAVGDTLIFVVDIVGTQLTGPSGTAVTPAAGLPSVGKDAKGFPTLTINTSATPPAKLVVQPLIQGTGAAIKSSDTIVVRYREYDWKSGKLIASDYEGNAESGAMTEILTAWQKGLVGQKVGSRVMIVAPPADAYPNGRATPSVAPGSTLVFVIDLLYAFATPTS